MKKEEPLISVIVPVYNVEKTLSRCIKSILIQTFTSFELILVDDGSIDKSGEICDEFARKDNRLIVIHQLNKGVSSARNRGLDIARGKYIAFCDSDDFVYAEWLQNFVDNICNVDLCTQSVEYVDCDNNHIVKILEDKEYRGIKEIREYITLLVKLGFLGYIFTKLFRKNIIEEYNLRFDVQSTFREDEQFLLSYIEHIESIFTTSLVGYCYFLPQKSKKYKNDSSNSLLPIINSLNRIFAYDLPVPVINPYYSSVEGAIVSSMLNNKLPDDKWISYLRELSYNIKLSQKKKFIFYLIVYSPYLKKISILLIKTIHRLTLKE